MIEIKPNSYVYKQTNDAILTVNFILYTLLGNMVVQVWSVS